MTEEASFGVRRLRKAIANQATCGSGQFELSIDSADRLCRECEDQLARLSWAEGIPAPVDADGNVVPLNTEVMYIDRGQKIELREFYLLHSVLRGGSVWRAIRHIDHDIEDWKLGCLHLRRPDSWELLEEDVARIGSADYPCDYFNHAGCGMPCYSCPAHTDAEDCIAVLARDVLRRAKALAERGEDH